MTAVFLIHEHQIVALKAMRKALRLAVALVSKIQGL